MGVWFEELDALAMFVRVFIGWNQDLVGVPVEEDGGGTLAWHGRTVGDEGLLGEAAGEIGGWLNAGIGVEVGTGTGTGTGAGDDGCR